MIVVGVPPWRAVEVGVGIREVIACFSNMGRVGENLAPLERL
jgi:hypothetical protein